MSQTPEHNMGHLINLKLNGIIYVGVVVAMYHAPPRTHTVNDARSILEIKVYPFCTLYMVCWDLVWDIGIRVPDMIFFNIHYR